ADRNRSHWSTSKTPSYTKSVSWQHHRDHSLNIYNPTEYYVVFAGLAVDKIDLTSKIEYIAPGEHKQLPLPASGGKNVKWAAINDYGGSSGTETRPLQ
ncbi:hypothetical protein MRO49_20775, partial [Escherichia coli]|uniref:fimbrial biogenesis chaperone n=1 Tax=Escherichia coli TaxID=562 RepID=UPI003CCC6A8E|nr:hypothetical protein [Escherichia coli]